MFLIFVGAAFFVVLCVFAFVAWKIFKLTRKHANSDLSVAVSALPAMEMKLESSNAEEWKESEQLNFTESELKKIGANHVGYYSVYNKSAIIKVSIWNYKNQSMAVIYETSSKANPKKVSFIYEVSCKLNSGSLCITSNPQASYDNPPKNHRIVFKESNSILDFLRAIKTGLPKGAKVQKIDDPKAYFLECYEDVSEWGWQEEQLKNDKTLQKLSSAGVSPKDKLVDELVEMGVSYSVEVNINRAKRRLASHSNMTAEQWEKIRDKLVFVNERMQTDHIINAVYELGGELTDSQNKVIKGFEKNTKELIDPVSAFQILLQSLDLKVKRITVMNEPVKTEVYLPL